MKISVKIDNVEIVIEEQASSDRTAAIRYGDQNEQIQKTIRVMADECIKLQHVSRSTPTTQEKA